VRFQRGLALTVDIWSSGGAGLIAEQEKGSRNAEGFCIGKNEPFI